MSGFNYFNLYVTISKSETSVVIRFLDKISYLVYQTVFDDVFVVKNELGNLNNLHIVLIELFSGEDDAIGANQLDIATIENKIITKINYSNKFSFNFSFESSIIGEKDLYREKIEKRIGNLETTVNNLLNFFSNKTFIHHGTEIPYIVKTIVINRSNVVGNVLAIFEKPTETLCISVHSGAENTMITFLKKILFDRIEVADYKADTLFVHFPKLEQYRDKITFRE